MNVFDFATNHYGEPDVSMFDFTLLYQAENSSRITVRGGNKLLTALAGDSLIEVGCDRDFIKLLYLNIVLYSHFGQLVTELQEGFWPLLT